MRHLERHGIRPTGEEGFFQAVPLRSFRLRTDWSSADLVRDGQVRPLRWLRDLTVAPTRSLPNRLQGRLIFAGSDNAAGLDLAGAIVVRLNPVRMVDGPAVPPPPQALDDLTQPWDREAATRFNEFFARLVAAIADADDPPRWRPGSPFAASSTAARPR